MGKRISFPSIRGMLLLALAALTSCGGSSQPGAAHDTKTTVVINKDASTSQDDAGVADAPGTAADTQASLDSVAISQYQPYDGGSSDLRMDPNTIFPCTGTPEEINDCIINLPTSPGIPVTRPAPMDYSACRP
jgi:hypothetical protein